MCIRDSWQTVHDLMEKDHGIATSNPLGFNNTYVMSVKPETAEQYNLKTLSDLIEKSPELNLGCTVEFIQREDCLPLLESKYDASFKDVSGLDASLRYDAIEDVYKRQIQISPISLWGYNGD